MSASVVPIRPGVTPEPLAGTVDEKLVKELQDLVERAKNGEIHGVAYVANCPGDLTYYGREGRITRGVLGALTILQYKIIQAAEDSA